MSGLQDDLAAYVYGDDDAPDEPPEPPEDTIGADRLLGRVRSYERTAAEIEGLAQANIAKIMAWRDDRISGVERSIAFHSRSLEVWMRSVHESSGGKVKTQNLPHGVLAVRKSPTRVVVDDDEAAAAIVADQRPEWVKVDRSIRKREALRDLFVGSPVLRVDDPPPEGYGWHEALDLCGWSSLWLLVLPQFRTVPYVWLLVPSRPSFSYRTHKAEAAEAEAEEQEETP